MDTSQNPCNEIPLNPGGFNKISIPLVRRIYPQLIANNIVSVQPLLGPTGLIYYLRHRYAQAKGQEVQDEPRKKVIKPKKYRSIDEPFEAS